MTNISAKELISVISLVPDDQPVFVTTDKDNNEGVPIRSYTLFRYADGAVQVTLYSDENCGLEL